MHRPEVNPLIRDVYRRLRLALGAEQAPLAKKIGVSVSKLSKWESDKGNLTDEQMKKLGDELHLLAEKHKEQYEGKPLEIFTPALFRQLREAHGISQTELANRAGLLQFTISMFECGHLELKRHDAERAVDALKRAMAERGEEIEQYQVFARLLH